MADVFISYKSDDRGAVEDIVRGLEREGVDLWWDQGIAPTTEWRADIAQQLHAAKVVIVVWSRNSADLAAGKWVIQEAEEADGRGALVPVVIDDVLPPLGMRHVQAADLVDWRGDPQDPRWRGFVETVRAKLEGRAVDARVARDTGPQTAKASLRGRVAQLFLALGLAALVVTSAIAFGPLTAAALVGGLLLSYVVLNLLFSRRRNDRAAATFLRRAFAVGWVTTITNIVVWCAAIGAGAYPYARDALYEDFSVAVFDELRTPIADAQVTIALGDARTRVSLNADGVGHVEYPLYWGPREAVVSIQHRDYLAERRIARDGQRFSDLTLGAPSGTERLRVRHITVRGLTMDAILHGVTPREFAQVMPALAGVVRNAVWEETDRYLSSFGVMGDPGDGDFTVEIRGDGEPATPGENLQWGNVDYRPLENLRRPEVGSLTLAADFASGIYGCPVDRALDANYQLILGDSHNYFSDSLLQPQPAAIRALNGLESLRDENGNVRGNLLRLTDHDWLAALLATNPRPLDEWSNRYMAALRFLTEHRPPAGLIIASFNLTSKNLSNCQIIEASVDLQVPEASLRVSIIENVSDQPMPVTAIIQGMAHRDAIEPWAPSDPDETVETPWAGGVLAPGAAIAVPRRLVVEEGLSPEDVAEWRARAVGPQVSFGVLQDPETAPTVSDANDPMITHNARGFAIHSNQVRFLDISNGVSTPLATPYVIGPSAESLAVRINDVDFELREDTGVVLAILYGVGVGSCPFVYAALPDGDVMLNRGTIITDQIGASAEGRSRRYLGRAVGRIEIRERESEVSRLNQVRLVVVGRDGRERFHAPAQRDLRVVDTAYARLARGDVLALDFPGYRPRDDDRAVYLEAVGYYTTLPMLMRDHLALRRSSIFN